MFSSLRRHLSYANVVATMALVFAMGGSAIAAKHYLLTSTSQISPQVLKALEVKIASRIKPGTPGKEGPAGKEGAAGKEGKEGKSLSVLSEAEQTRLKSILAATNYLPSGIDGKPTIQFSGVNVQVVSGAGSEEATVNGLGNVIVGYDENPGAQTGSNNIVIGSANQSYSSFGAILGGEDNIVEGPYGDAFGFDNEVGSGVKAASVTGGSHNHAAGEWSSISGGYENRTEKVASSVTGGLENQALATQASVTGGSNNKAAFEYSSVVGGKELKTKAAYETLP